MTHDRIERLGESAAEHGDLLMAAICQVALDGSPRDTTLDALDSAEQARVQAMTAEAATEECRRVLADIDAQTFADSYDAFSEYIDPDATTSEAEFAAMTRVDRLALIHEVMASNGTRA